MLDYLTYEHGETALVWMLRYDGFRLLSALMYVIFGVGLFRLGVKYHAATMCGANNVGQFPPGYFSMLAVQLIPLLVTGLIISDPYIVGTRIWTLVMVLVVYAFTLSKDGTFLASKFRWWVLFWLAVAIMAPMLWAEHTGLRTFVHDWESIIVWVTIGSMILFVVRGQWEVAKALFHHFLAGNYSIKRFSLQVVRFFGFFFQAVHYFFVPSNAPAVIWGTLDPIFVQGAIGTLGVSMVLIWALLGVVRGKRSKAQDGVSEQQAPAQ